MDTQVQYSNSRTFVTQLIQSVGRLKDIADRLVSRSLETSVDMKQIASELRYAICFTLYDGWGQGVSLVASFSCNVTLQSAATVLSISFGVQ